MHMDPLEHLAALHEMNSPEFKADVAREKAARLVREADSKRRLYESIERAAAGRPGR